MQPKNLAAVVVTAELPAFAQRGQRIDVNVSSAGNAKSLRGGMLLATPLRGADGRVYAIAQGNLIVGGAGAAAGGSKVQINHLSAGRVPDGAMVEEVVATTLGEDGVLQLDVNANDFATARAVAAAINEAKGAGTAQALDGRVVKVRCRPSRSSAWASSPTSRTCRWRWPCRQPRWCSMRAPVRWSSTRRSRWATARRARLAVGDDQFDAGHQPALALSQGGRRCSPSGPTSRSRSRAAR